MSEAINIISLFVPKGSLAVSSKGKGQMKEYHTQTEPIDTCLPITVMIDGGSASASEIVSGGLQDLGRATIKGKTSFGKGLVQSIRPLPYNGQMKVTTAKYYTPSGRCVQGIGVKPDVEIDIPSYSRLVYLVNKYRISLKNCCFINMDEYLKDENTYIDKADPLSFRGGMERIFYNLIDEELNVLPENRIFPEPGKESIVMEKIKEYGKLDMAWGGVGINGHFAFNEPPEPGEEVTPEEFLDRPTRVLKISRETKTINCFMNCAGDLDGIPEYCITVGMKEMFMAKKVRMCMPRDWNAGALRKVLHGGITAKVPCSLFQKHSDAKLYAANVALASPIPEIRIYNK